MRTLIAIVPHVPTVRTLRRDFQDEAEKVTLAMAAEVAWDLADTAQWVAVVSACPMDSEVAAFTVAEALPAADSQEEAQRSERTPGAKAQVTARQVLVARPAWLAVILLVLQRARSLAEAVPQALKDRRDSFLKACAPDSVILAVDLAAASQAVVSGSVRTQWGPEFGHADRSQQSQTPMGRGRRTIFRTRVVAVAQTLPTIAHPEVIAPPECPALTMVCWKTPPSRCLERVHRFPAARLQEPPERVRRLVKVPAVSDQCLRLFQLRMTWEVVWTCR
jgi:hypothetical protein